jgi:hypothetical protein
MTQRPRRLRLRSSRRVSSELSFGPEGPTVDNRPTRVSRLSAPDLILGDFAIIVGPSAIQAYAR